MTNKKKYAWAMKNAHVELLKAKKRRGQEAAGAGISKEGRSAEVKDHLSLGFLDHHLQVLG